MTHYAHILTLERLEIMTHLGFYDEERGKRQRVEICLRLYFPKAPACAEDDFAQFMDYGALAKHLTEWVQADEFRLIEFMGQQAFYRVRAYLDAHGCEAAKLWLKLTKCDTPVPNLRGSASFIHSDLPVGSTTAYAPVL